MVETPVNGYLGHVGVGLVRHEDPPRRGVGVHDALDVRDEVLLGPRWANAWFDHLPGCDDEVGNQAERAMALVLELDITHAKAR